MTTPDDTKDQAPPERLRVSAEDFVAIWMGEKVPEGEIKNRLLIEKDWKDEEVLSFFNIEVVGNISIENQEEKLKNLTLDNSNTGDIYIDNSNTGYIYIRNNSNTGDIYIRNNSNTGDIYIDNSKTGYISIRNNSKTGYISIRNNSNTGDISIYNSKTGYISIYNSKILDLALSGNVVCQRVQISSLSTAGIFRIAEGTKVGSIVLEHTLFKRIELENAGFIGRFHCRFLADQANQLIFKNTPLGKLDFEDTVFPESTTLSASDCSINELSFRNTCNYGSLFFCNLKSLEKWEDFKRDEKNNLIFENGEYQFQEKSNLSILRFIDSDLGKVQFINSDLRHFKKFEFLNTKMLEVFVAGSQMPDDTQFQLPEGSNANINEQKRLAYGQFKRIYENQGDTAGSLHYLAQEMDAYHAQLREEGRWKHRGELFMLWMNKISTNHGTSWQHGLLSTIVALIFFYSIFCLLIGYRWDWSARGFEGLWKLISYAPYYLNPLRDKDSIFLIEEGDFNAWSRLWDFISRIFLTYFVYQTIQAFRKLGKSSG